jgi:glutathione S-transferase
MKLLDQPFSPYSSRVRMVVRYKNLPIAFEKPPTALGTAEFKASFPLGKIPILELDNGSFIPESWAIMEYLEDVYPEVPLRPQDPLARAQMRVLGRVADLHLAPVLFPIFVMLKQSSRDLASATRHVEAISAELLKLSRLLDEYGLPSDRGLNLGDIALVQNILFIETIFPVLGAQNPFTNTPLVAKWWAQVKEVPAIAQSIAEFDQGFRGFLKQLGVDLSMQEGRGFSNVNPD